jgi:hypothetical protein
MLSEYNLENPVPIRDLTSGLIIDYRGPDNFESIGEFIFWACLDNVLKTPPDMLRVAYLTVVHEPGKGRSVTKGRACVKVILDTVAKICAWPLKKGITSSTRGMGQSHHAWNAFLSLMSEEMKDEVFSVKSQEDVEFGDYIERKYVYEDLFSSSTDYQESTDRIKHWFASMAGNAWMNKCGIPPILRGIVNAVCYRERTIVFSATGGLASYGEPSNLSEATNARQITLRQGILMGDPLTKIVLHLSNIVARRIGDKLGDPESHRSATNPEQAAAAYIEALLNEESDDEEDT